MSMICEPDSEDSALLPTTGQVTSEILDVLAPKPCDAHDDKVRAILAEALRSTKDTPKEELLIAIWLLLEDVRDFTGLTLAQGLRAVGCRNEIDDEVVEEASLEKLQHLFALLSSLRETACQVFEHTGDESVVRYALVFGPEHKRAIDYVRRAETAQAVVISLSYPKVFLESRIAAE